MSPPSSTARKHALANWRTHPLDRGTAGPMAQQQQQQHERQPYMQLLTPQRHIGKQPEPVSAEQAERARKELERKGVVAPDGQKKKPLPGETTGAA